MIPLNDPGLDRLRDAIRRRGERSASRALSAAVGAQTVSLALAVGCSWATVYEAAQPRSRSGDRYRPATIRRHELAWRRHLEPVIGHKQLTDIDRECMKALRAGFIRAGMASSTIANTFDPLRVVIREALEDGRLTVDPIAGMRIATGKKGRREHVANRAEAQVLIDALPVSEQALWATALYAGLRRGELKALRCHDLDFEADRIVVHHGWDHVEGEAGTKSDAAQRDVPLIDDLRKILMEHKLASGPGEGDLVFGRTATLPFVPSTVGERSRRAWGWKKIRNPELKRNPRARPKEVWVKAREDALQPIVLHESRHSAASYAREAGLDDVELAAFVGHSDSRTTKSIYVHLFDDSTEKVTAKLNAYHKKAG